MFNAVATKQFSINHQFQINQRLCILRHAYLHKNIQLPTNFLNNNKALINFLSFVYSINHKRFDISFQVHDFKDLGNSRETYRDYQLSFTKAFCDIYV